MCAVVFGWFASVFMGWASTNLVKCPSSSCMIQEPKNVTYSS